MVANRPLHSCRSLTSRMASAACVHWHSMFGSSLSQDTRSLDGKTSLLVFLARHMCTRKPLMPVLADELPAVVGSTLKTSAQVCMGTIQCVQIRLRIVHMGLRVYVPSISGPWTLCWRNMQQEVSDMLVRVEASLADVRTELSRTPPAARLIITTVPSNNDHDGMDECVAVRVIPDNYHDLMSATVEVRQSYLALPRAVASGVI